MNTDVQLGAINYEEFRTLQRNVAMGLSAEEYYRQTIALVERVRMYERQVELASLMSSEPSPEQQATLDELKDQWRNLIEPDDEDTGNTRLDQIGHTWDPGWPPQGS